MPILKVVVTCGHPWYQRALISLIQNYLIMDMYSCKILFGQTSISTGNILAVSTEDCPIPGWGSERRGQPRRHCLRA